MGISNYKPEETRKAAEIMKQLGTPLLIHQPRYNLIDRWVEDGLLQALRDTGMGMIAFSPLAGGRLTGKYRQGIPKDSRAGHDPRYLRPDMITEELGQITDALGRIAERRGQTLPQLALQWVLRDPVVTSVLIGASRPEQIEENCSILSFPPFTQEELSDIEKALLAGKEA